MQTLARIRGAFVGLISGSVSIGGHGLGGGAMALSESSLLLLVGVCTAAGAAVTPGQVKNNRLMVLVLFLGLGQILGHLILTLSHGHAAALVPSPTMTMGHLSALVLTALMLRSAEGGLISAFGFIARLLDQIFGDPAGLVPMWTATLTRYRGNSARALVCATAGTRGPPLSV